MNEMGVHLKRKQIPNKFNRIVKQRKMLLNSFQKECELIKKEEIKPCNRIDLVAWTRLEQRGELLTKPPKTIGKVEGVEIEDEFKYRLELHIMGIQSQRVRGIDYDSTSDGRIIAISIVAVEGYYDILVSPEEVIYTGEGGTYDTKNKVTKLRQNLTGGNLALSNSKIEGKVIRVIRGLKNAENRGITYIYDGLYKVTDYWRKLGELNKIYLQFKLRRCSNQKCIDWNKYKSSFK